MTPLQKFDAIRDFRDREKFLREHVSDKISTHALHVLEWHRILSVDDLCRALDSETLTRKSYGVGPKTWWELVGAAGRDPAAFPYKKANICPHCGKPIARSK